MPLANLDATTQLIAAASVGLVAGALLVWAIMLPLVLRLRARLATAREREEERLQDRDALREAMKDTFSALSGEALNRNNDAFLRLAEDKLGQYQQRAREDLGERERAVEALVRPLREALGETQQQLQRLEETRREAYGSLAQQLASVAETQQALRGETANLVKALRRPEVRGRWGEMTLRRLVELAGMVEHCDFEEQSAPDSGTRLRPDMTVRMPSGRTVVVDAKTPLDAYVDAVEATDDAEREACLRRHAGQLRRQMTALAEKGYWRQFDRTPDFVVLFIPGEQFLTAALDRDRNLLEDALARQVILATPTTLIALLRAIAQGWREEQLASHAEEIRRLGEQLQSRMGTFTDHLAKLGRALGSSVDHYNRALGSLERQVMPSLRRFGDLGVASGSEPSTPDELETRPRPPRDAPEGG